MHVKEIQLEADTAEPYFRFWSKLNMELLSNTWSIQAIKTRSDCWHRPWPWPIRAPNGSSNPQSNLNSQAENPSSLLFWLVNSVWIHSIFMLFLLKNVLRLSLMTSKFENMWFISCKTSHVSFLEVEIVNYCHKHTGFKAIISAHLTSSKL